MPRREKQTNKQWGKARKDKHKRVTHILRSPHLSREINTGTRKLDKAGKCNTNNHRQLQKESKVWCGWVLNSLLRDHSRSAQTQLLGSKMDSLDSPGLLFFTRITLLFSLSTNSPLL